MMVGDGFFFKAFYMDVNTIVIVVGITLTPHATRAMFVQGAKISFDHFLCGLFPALRHGEGHNIPYHIAYSFGFSR